MGSSQTVKALIVRNINDVESAYEHAVEIGNEVFSAMQSEASDRLEPLGWKVDSSKDSDGDTYKILLAPAKWYNQEDDHADPRFVIEEFEGPDGETDATFLAEFLQAGPHGASIALVFSCDQMRKPKYRKSITSQSSVALRALLDAGFEVDNNRWIRFPIKLEIEKVAQGAEDGDLLMR